MIYLQNKTICEGEKLMGVRNVFDGPINFAQDVVVAVQRKNRDRKAIKRLGKKAIKPVGVENKSELAMAVRDKEKVIYIVGTYYEEVKKNFSKNNISLYDIEEIRQKHEEEKRREAQKHREFAEKSPMHLVISALGEILEFGLGLALLPLGIILVIFGVLDDEVQKEIKNYKVVKNRKYKRIELYRVSGDEKIDNKKEYVAGK